MTVTIHSYRALWLTLLCEQYILQFLCMEVSRCFKIHQNVSPCEIQSALAQILNKYGDRTSVHLLDLCIGTNFDLHSEI